MGEKGLGGQLGLVLEPDPAPGFMVSHYMLEDHNLQHLLGLVLGKLALVHESSYSVFFGMDTFIV